MRRAPRTTGRPLRPAATIAVVIGLTLLSGSLVSPAFGGPSLSGLRRSVAKALKLARSADARSRRALAVAGRPGPAGPVGATGPAGPAANGTTGAGGAAGVVPLDFRENPPSTKVIYSRGGLVLTATCGAGPNILVDATTTVDHSVLHAETIQGNASPTPPTVTYTQKNDFLTTSLPQHIAATGTLEGSLTYSTPTGTVTTVTFGAEQGVFGAAAAKGCWFGGMAVTSAP